MRVLLTPILLMSLTVPSYAKLAEKTWTDVNYVPCEGVGIHGTGKITARAETDTKDGFTKMTSLQVSTRYYITSTPSVLIIYRNPQNVRQEIRLVPPWFSTLEDRYTKSRYLPRNKTLPTSSSKEQGAIHIKNGSKIEIIVNTMLKQDGGNCATNFSTEWNL